MSGPVPLADVATQRDTAWQAGSQGRQADAGRNCRCRARTSLDALTPGLGTGLPKVQHARVLRGATADPGAVRPLLAAGGIGNGGAPRSPRTPACHAVVTERCSPTLVRSSPTGA